MSNRGPTKWAVIFDFDGVILDSETPEFEAHRRLFGSYGLSLTIEEWTVGIGALNHPRFWFDRLLHVAKDLEFDEFVRRRREIFRKIVRMQPIDGITPLMDALEGAGVPMGIASNASSDWVHGAAAEIGIAHRFAAIVTAEEVAQPKPAPDIYLEAARRLGVTPSAAVAIEDSATGVASARAAGLRTVAVPHWLTSAHDLAGADLIIAHAAELSVDRLLALIHR